MFGRIRTFDPELKIKDDIKYRGYYCGLCEALSRIDQRSRLMLSHDCTFLYILHSSLDESEETAAEKRCIEHPVKKRLHILNPHADYAAAVDVLLGAADLRDKKEDGQKLFAGLEYSVYKGTVRRTAEKHEDLFSLIDGSVERLKELEKEGSKDIDRTADTFAGLLGSIFLLDEEREDRALYEMGYQLGRWIYLMDALEDRKEDAEKGNYNVFNARFGGDEETLKESARFNILSSLNQAVLAYDLLDIKRNKELLDNIMYLGLNNETKKVFDKEGMNGSV